MKTNHVPSFLALTLALLGPIYSAHAAAVVWDGGGDGVSWNDANNWSNNVLPTASDDVVISGVGASVTIIVGANVTVQSLQCSASLNVASGNLSLTKGASQVVGDFTVATGRALSASGTNTVFTANGPVTLNGASLYANNGAVVVLAGVGQVVRTGNYDVTWRAEGAGSRIVLAGLTNVVGYLNAGWARFQSEDGGRVELPAVTTLTNGWFQAYAEGVAAVVDLSGLTSYQVGRSDQYLAVEARNNGAVLLPQLTDGQNVVLTLRSGGAVPVGQFTRLAQVTLDAVSVTFSNLATLDDTTLTVQNGAVLELPWIGRAVRTGNFDVVWRAEGAGSRIVLAGLTNVVGYLNAGWSRFQAYSGGRVELPAVTTLTNGWFQAYADGVSAVVDLSGLTSYQVGRTDQYLAVEARNNGAVLLPQLTEGERVVLTLRSGGSVPVGQFTRLAQVTLDGVSVTFSNLATLDDTTLTVQNGAVLELPWIGRAVRTGNFDVVWRADGADSRIVLAGLTNVMGYLNGAWTRFQAHNGGRVELPAVTTLTNGWFQAYADGVSAVVDLSGLTSYQVGRADQYLAVETRNNGAVLLPQLTEGERVVLTLRSGGSVPVGQFTRLAQVTLDGVSVTFSNLATLDDTTLTVQNGAVLELPWIGRAVRTGNFDVVWRADGAGSRIVLAGLTNVMGYLNGGWSRFQAHNGGRVELPAVTTLTNGWFQAYADGVSAVVDLSGLTSYQVGRADQYLAVEARNNGAMSVPQFTNLQRVVLTLRGAGSVIPVGQVTSLDDASLYTFDGAVLALPQIGRVERTGNFDVVWRAEGTGSRIVLTGLTNVVGFTSAWWRFQAYNGGRVEFPAVTMLTNGSFQAYADGTAAAVDLSGLASLTAGSGKQVQVNAKNRGSVDLRAVQSISGGGCSINADGTGSVIDLSSLSAFATPLGASELKALNGGTILLPGNVFLLVNVAVQIAGHPVLPSVASASASVSLHGRAWRSYWVEWRDTRTADGPWQLYGRMAQTNTLQVIGGPPQSWQAFRVWEFMADPPLVDLHNAGAGHLYPILFGATNKAYHLETAASVDASLGAWLPWGASTGTMTNTFRILSSFPATETQQFFRAKQE